MKQLLNTYKSTLMLAVIFTVITVFLPIIIDPLFFDNNVFVEIYYFLNGPFSLLLKDQSSLNSILYIPLIFLNFFLVLVCAQIIMTRLNNVNMKNKIAIIVIFFVALYMYTPKVCKNPPHGSRLVQSCDCIGYEHSELIAGNYQNTTSECIGIITRYSFEKKIF